MNPILFGASHRRLLGMFHAAESKSPRDASVLLCAPFGHEALRTHRFYRLLAVRLARQGFDVLRFDCYGTGDSPGSDEEGDLLGWRSDIREAHAELVRRSNAGRVVWFAARLAGSLAIQASALLEHRPKKMVLWEPVLDGAPYLQTLRDKHVEELEFSHAIPRADWRRQLRQDPTSFTEEVLGHAISPVLRQQILDLEPQVLTVSPVVETTVIAKPDDLKTRQWAVAQHAAGAKVQYEALMHSLMWTSNPHPDNEMVPADALQRVIAAIHHD